MIELNLSQNEFDIVFDMWTIHHQKNDLYSAHIKWLYDVFQIEYIRGPSEFPFLRFANDYDAIQFKLMILFEKQNDFTAI